MRPTAPPSMANWLLNHLGRANEALAGDLLEEYRRGRSDAWYWRQVLTAVAVSRSREALLTVGVLAIYSIGHYVPIPGTDTHALAALGGLTRATSFQFYDLFTGGNLAPVTVFALGILPYISASIVVQLTVLLWRSLTPGAGSLSPRGMLRYTRLVAILLCSVQAYGIAVFLERQSAVAGGLPLVDSPGWVFRLTTVVILTCGTAVLMWLSDDITERGIGNGMFLTFAAGVLVGLPSALSTASRLAHAGLLDSSGVLASVGRIAGSVAVVATTAHFYRRATQPRQLT